MYLRYLIWCILLFFFRWGHNTAVPAAASIYIYYIQLKRYPSPQDQEITGDVVWLFTLPWGLSLMFK